MARLMIIDDDMMVSRFLEEHLTADGHEVKSYSMAEEGFQAAIANPPDLFLLDVMLPDATGFQMVGRFRQHPKTHDVPIIMMSGTARHSNQKEIGRDMGADEYLVKPIDSTVVSEKINHLLTTKPKHGTPAFVAPSETFPQPSSPTPSPMPVPSPVASPMPIPSPEPVRQALPPQFSVFEPPAAAAEAAPNGGAKEFRLPEFEYTESREPEDSAPEPLVQKPYVPKAAFNPKISWVGGLIGLQTVFAIVQGLMAQQAISTVFRGACGIIAGWALLLGLLVAACAIAAIAMTAEQALSLLFWPALPILARAALAVAGLKMDPQFATPAFYWLRPLDIFEMAALFILGFTLRKKPGSTMKKTVLISLFLAFSWCLTNRGYFQP